jgi:hypothetical protein
LNTSKAIILPDDWLKSQSSQGDEVLNVVLDIQDDAITITVPKKDACSAKENKQST